MCDSGNLRRCIGTHSTPAAWMMTPGSRSCCWCESLQSNATGSLLGGSEAPRSSRSATAGSKLREPCWASPSVPCSSGGRVHRAIKPVLGENLVQLVVARWRSAGAFRQALEQRLKSISPQEGTDFHRLCRRVAFDRFLARVSLLRISECRPFRCDGKALLNRAEQSVYHAQRIIGKR